MLPEDKLRHITRVRALLKQVRAVSVATVSPGSLPHNSPVFATFDRDFNVIWASHPSSRHSQNIAHTGEVFISVFDASCAITTGLYIEAAASILEPDDQDFTAAIQLYAKAKQAMGAPLPMPEDFSQPQGQRLYCAVPHHLWINYAAKNDRGVVVHDQRFRITAAALRGETD